MSQESERIGVIESQLRDIRQDLDRVIKATQAHEDDRIYKRGVRSGSDRAIRWVGIVVIGSVLFATSKFTGVAELAMKILKF